MKTDRIDIIQYREFHTSPPRYDLCPEDQEWSGTGECVAATVTRRDGESDESLRERAVTRRAELEVEDLDQ